MIIDAHNHPDWHGYNLERFLENMAQNGISRTWLLSWESPMEDCCDATTQCVCGPLLNGRNVAIPFERCISYAERAPEKFILGYCPNPDDPFACDKLVAAYKIYNIRICGECKFRTMYDSPDCLRLFRQAGELGLPVTLHFDYDQQFTRKEPRSEWWGGNIGTLERMLQACPNTNFLGHAPGFWIHISNDDLWSTKNQYPEAGTPVIPGGKIPELLDKYPNLYCDISAGSGHRALNRDHEFTKQFLVKYQDRIVYARDYFDNVHQELLNSLQLPEEVLEKIYHLNAEKLIHA
ncbi:MAG: amidohydrolase [Lentisphaeria bacterium]|nr:amidohydrolase [Lentisphaeria bacterium]